MKKYKSCSTSCNVEKDGIDTDYMYLFPKEIYSLIKKRAKIKSNKPYCNKHKKWLKAQAAKRNMRLLDYLSSLSPEVSGYIKVIRTMEDGGQLDSSLDVIANEINQRLEEITNEYNVNREKIQTYKKGGKYKKLQEGGTVDKSDLLDKNIESTKGYSSTGFIKVDNPSEALEADACYVIDSNNKPRKVPCEQSGSVKGSMLTTKDGKTYYMREQTKVTTTTKDGPQTIKSWQSPTSEGNKEPGDDNWFKKEGCGTCTGKNSTPKTLTDLKNFIDNGDASVYVKRFLNNLISSAKGAGVTDSEAINVVMASNMKSFEEAAKRACFCASSGTKVTSIPTDTITADRKVDVVSESQEDSDQDDPETEKPKPVKDTVEKFYKYYGRVEIPIPPHISPRGGKKSDTAYFSVKANVNNGEYNGFTVAQVQLSKAGLQGLAGGFSGQNTTSKGNNNIGIITTKVPSKDESKFIFGKENDAFIQNFVKEAIVNKLSQGDIKNSIDAWIKEKVEASKSQGLEEEEFGTTQSGMFTNRNTTIKQVGGNFKSGKEFLALSRKKHSERDISEYIKNYVHRISPKYLK